MFRGQEPTDIINNYMALKETQENLELHIQALRLEEIQWHHRIIKIELARLETMQSNALQILLLSAERPRPYTITFSGHQFTWEADGHIDVLPEIPIDYLKRVMLRLFSEKTNKETINNHVKELMFYEAIKPQTHRPESKVQSEGSLDQEAPVSEEEVKNPPPLSAQPYRSDELERVSREIKGVERIFAMEILQSYHAMLDTNKMLIKNKQELEAKNKNQADRLEESYQQNEKLCQDIASLREQLNRSNQNYAALEKTATSLQAQLAVAHQERDDLQQQHEKSAGALETKEESPEISVKALRDLLTRRKPWTFHLFATKEVIFEKLERLLAGQTTIKLAAIKGIIAHDTQLTAIIDNPTLHPENKTPIAALIRDLANLIKEPLHLQLAYHMIKSQN